jgi:hypothetical protein
MLLTQYLAVQREGIYHGHDVQRLYTLQLQLDEELAE